MSFAKLYNFNFTTILTSEYSTAPYTTIAIYDGFIFVGSPKET